MDDLIWGGQHARPPGGQTWEEWKAVLFHMFAPIPGEDHYKIYDDEVAKAHRSDASIVIVSAPARTSKSLFTSMDVLAYVMPLEPLVGSLSWIIGPDYPTNKEFQYLWTCLVDQRERHHQKIETARNNPGNGDMIITIDHGRDKHGHRCRAVIKGMSSTNERTLQGEEVACAVLSEAAEHPAHIWTKYLSTRSWRTYLPTTPKPKAQWIRELVEQGEKDPSLGIAHFNFPPGANPAYNWKRYERAKRQAEMKESSGKAEDNPYFAEQFLGRWVYYTGLVLPFEERKHVLAEIPDGFERARIFVSVDYGYDHPAVALFWAAMPNGRIVIFDEVYERGLSTPEFVDRVFETLANHECEDRLEYAVGDPARPEVARIFREAGLNVWDHDKNALRDRAAGHRQLIDYLTLQPAPGFPGLYPGLYLTRNCTHTIAEWKHLRYKEHHTGEYGTTALEGGDDAFDAARYGVQTRPRAVEDTPAESSIAAYIRARKHRSQQSYTREQMLGLDLVTGRAA